MQPKENVALQQYTTMQVGGPAHYFFEVSTAADLAQATRFAHDNNLPILIIGGGSNILIGDEGFKGVAIRVVLNGIEAEPAGDAFRVIASAGEQWDSVAQYVVRNGLWGTENLSYIPGTVGGAVVQNIGAYGVEIREHIEWVEVFDTTDGSIKKLLNSECALGYRNSIFKNDSGKNYIVTRVAFLLHKTGNPILDYADLKKYFADHTNTPTPIEIRNAVISIRKKKLPDHSTVGTAGSFFKNPIIPTSLFQELQKTYPELRGMPVDESRVKVSAAWLIEHTGYKGKQKGAVGIHKDHALIIVNTGNATARDIFSFAECIKRDVQKKFNIALEEEVVFVK